MMKNLIRMILISSMASFTATVLQAQGFEFDDEDIDLPGESSKREEKVESDMPEETNFTRHDRIKSVSRKLFLKRERFEFNPLFAVSVNDAFFRHYFAGARMSYHLADSFALEVGGLFNVLPESQRLAPIDIVRQQLSHVVDENHIHRIADFGFTFSPIYGKFALLQNWIIHFDTYLLSGLGFVFDANAGSLTRAGSVGMSPAVEFGGGLRIFLTDWMALRGEMRNYMYTLRRGVFAVSQNLLFAQVGVSFYLPTRFEYRYTAAKVVDQ